MHSPSLYGPSEMIARQLGEVFKLGFPIELVTPHPVPTPAPGGPRPDFMERFATEVIPLLRTDEKGSESLTKFCL